MISEVLETYNYRSAYLKSNNDAIFLKLQCIWLYFDNFAKKNLFYESKLKKKLLLFQYGIFMVMKKIYY